MRVLCHHCDKPLEYAEAAWVDGFPYHAGSCDRYYVVGYRHLCVFCTCPIREAVYVDPTTDKPCHKGCLDRQSMPALPAAPQDDDVIAAKLMLLRDLDRRVSALEQRLAHARQA